MHIHSYHLGEKAVLIKKLLGKIDFIIHNKLSLIKLPPHCLTIAGVHKHLLSVLYTIYLKKLCTLDFASPYRFIPEHIKITVHQVTVILHGALIHVPEHGRFYAVIRIDKCNILTC